MLVHYRSSGIEGFCDVLEQADINAFLAKLDEADRQNGGTNAIAPTTTSEAVGILRYFVECVHHSETPSRWVTNWVASAFESALRDASPAKQIARSLGLVRGQRGQPKKAKRDLALYGRMKDLVAAGCSVLESSHRCAEEFRVHEANAQKTYYLFKKLYDSWEPPL